MIRKSLIYKAGVEYGDYTLNHVKSRAAVPMDVNIPVMPI